MRSIDGDWFDLGELESAPERRAGQEAPRAQERRLPYWPALDGVRGLAVAAVLLFHGGILGARGGFLGVSVFFTLSGFLITSLLVAEHSDTGRVSLGSFWARRARRLVPASLLTLVLAGIVVIVRVPGLERPEIVNDMRAALLNVANWRLVQQGAVYGDLTTTPSPVQHYWSLAIEEQFYLFFPLLAAVALRRRVAGLVVALSAITVLSVVRQVVLDDNIAVYYSTDTRASELAIGGLLAIACARTDLLRAVPSWLLDVSGVVALGALTVLVTQVSIVNERLFDGAFAAIAVASSLLVLGATSGRFVPRALAFRPLVHLGRISYGVYLFHFPLYILLDEEHTGLDRWPLLGVRITASIWLAAASFMLLESPIRSGRAIRGRLAPVAIIGSFAALLAITLPLSSSGREGESRFEVVIPDVPTDDAPGSLDAITSTTAPGATSTARGATPGVGATPSTLPAAGPPRSTAPVRAPRVLVVGDSTAGSNGDGLRSWGEEDDRLVVDTVYEPGCGTLPGKHFLVRDGFVFTPKNCDSLFARAAQRAQSFGADAVVVFTGSSQLGDWTYEGQGGLRGVHHIGEPAVDQAYRSALDRNLDALEQLDIPILWATLPIPAWDLEVYAQRHGVVMPGSGPVTINDPERTARLNQLTAEVLRHRPLVAQWAYAEQLQRADGSVSSDVRPDGLHLSPEGVAAITDAWLFRTLDRAFDGVRTRNPSLRLIQRHTWSAEYAAG